MSKRARLFWYNEATSRKIHDKRFASEIIGIVRSMFNQHAWAVTPDTLHGDNVLLLARGESIIKVIASKKFDAVAIENTESLENSRRCLLADIRDGGEITINAEPRDDAGIRKEVTRYLERVRTFHAQSGDHVPYGLVRNGKVVAVYWVYESAEVTKRGKTFNPWYTSCFVPEGESLPSELLYKLSSPDGGGWYGRFEKMVASGQLVRLSDRLKKAKVEGELLASRNSHLIITESRPGSPAFLPRYVCWDLTGGEWKYQGKDGPGRYSYSKDFFN